MSNDYHKEQRYIRAKKRVKDIKGFYTHFIVYILVNIFISSVIVFGLTRDEGNTYREALKNFGVYSTWIFWGIGMLFHWLGVFGFKNIGLGKNWEEKKIRELMEKDEHKF